MAQIIRKSDERPVLSSRVLVAEDNPLNQSLVQCYFDEIGCAVDIVKDGIEAVRRFQEGRYDIVFMDCKMPNLDGFGATRKIREDERRRAPATPVPIIALTASAADEVQKDCLAAGMDGWLEKPFSVDQLRSVLDRWLPGRRPPERRRATPGDEEGPAAPDSATGAVVDQGALDAIRALETDTHPDVLTRIVETYLASATAQIDRLAEALSDNDTAAVVAAAHSLKSSSANVGAGCLSELCRELESVSRAGGDATMPSLCERIVDEFERVRAALAEIGDAGAKSA